MTPDELDAAEVRIGSLDREWVAETMRDMVAALRAAWAERDTYRAEAERAHRLAEAYREAFEATVACYEPPWNRPTPTLDAALARLRALGWTPEAER